MRDIEAEFLAEIRSHGLNPPERLVPGKIHRFPGIDKPASNTAGWCLLFEDGRGGVFGDWSSDLRETWFADQPEPGQPRRVVSAESRREQEALRVAKQKEAAGRAEWIWEQSAQAPSNHPYLVRKQIAVNGARLYKGSLVIPITDVDGNLTSLQFIKEDGTKQLLHGGRKKGCFMRTAHDTESPSKIMLCEGWATGCTLAVDFPRYMVVSAVDARNLEHVASELRRRWPSVYLVIAADDDRLNPENTGLKAATKVAQLKNTKLYLPPWPNDAPLYLTDFNDLAVWKKGGTP